MSIFFLLTQLRLCHKYNNRPSIEGRSAGEAWRGWRRRLRLAVFANRGPGSPWRDASGPIMRPRVNVLYTFPQAAKAAAGSREWGTKDLRRRSGAPYGEAGSQAGRLSFARGRHPGCALWRSAPSFGSEDALRALRSETKTLPSGSEIENKICNLRGNPAARMVKLGCLIIRSGSDPHAGAGANYFASWPGLSRPSTSLLPHKESKTLDARHKAGMTTERDHGFNTNPSRFSFAPRPSQFSSSDAK